MHLPWVMKEGLSHFSDWDFEWELALWVGGDFLVYTSPSLIPQPKIFVFFVGLKVFFVSCSQGLGCVYANFSHFQLSIFRLRIFCLFKCPFRLSKILCKCEYCLIWVLNKSILFGSNSLKVSSLCDMYFEKSVCIL